ncbi:HAD family hydrolase [Facklamia lactis]|uniref:HAD family hydrolase n=1 Tax=Facklamia lactis TaxID=2749967 RepID=UPI0018CD99D7|nr:HAD family hydrolase [Facklamia lactis]MBG9979742.1 HAD family phosphatase [Facklamia lactis]
MIKLIMIDMDGTLFNDQKTYDQERFDQVVKTLTDQGVIVTIATGNTDALVKREISHASYQRLHLAVTNGNLTKNIHQIINVFSIDRPLLEEVHQYILDHQYPFSMIAITEQHDYKILNFVPENNEIDFYFPEAISLEEIKQIPADEDIIMLEIFAHGLSLEEIKRISQEVTQQFTQLTSVSAGDQWLDIYHQEGGKGTAAKILQDYYEIKADESMAFGDSLNDQSMMENVHYSMAMANADPDLLPSCNYQIGDNNEQAVIQILEEIANGQTNFEDYRLKRS